MKRVEKACLPPRVALLDAGGYRDGEVRHGAELAVVTGLGRPDRLAGRMRVSFAARNPHPGRSCRCSRPTTAGVTKPSRPTPPPASFRSWKPGIVRTPGSRPRIEDAKDTAWAGSHHGSTPSTRPGFRSRRRRGPHRLAAAARRHSDLAPHRAQDATASGCCTRPLGLTRATGTPPQHLCRLSLGRPGRQHVIATTVWPKHALGASCPMRFVKRHR